MVSVPVDAGAVAGAAVSDDGAAESAAGAALSAAGAGSAMVFAGSSREEQAATLNAQSAHAVKRTANNLDAIARLRTPARAALLHQPSRAQRVFSRFTKAPGSAS